ncbi:unnamed protein product [Microthlaspi erraticum]|uniref:F-box domain-containing protein n=1 Tax=Microthlaspi erraticum TaxID=1685480 RepID=A0A6D2K750_9BRAS|nr:unnamed protein product [Microthlaspi erraticum]
MSELPDDLLVKILSFLPTKSTVSTSILSKRWEFLWMWLPKLEYDEYYEITGPKSSWLRYEEFIDKNLPLHRAPVIESLLLRFCYIRLSQPEKIKQWVGIAVSRLVRELSISYFCFNRKVDDVLSLPSSLYTCNSLMTLKLQGNNILVDVPQVVCLPSLKTLKLQGFAILNEDSLRLLLSHCPVLEDLCIELDDEDGKVRALVVNVPSLQRLSLEIDSERSSSDGYVIVTPCLKYLKIVDYREFPSYMIEPMPKLEEADIEVTEDIETILEPITSVRRLSLNPWFSCAGEFAYPVGIVFSQLEHLKLCICSENWSTLLLWLLGISPKLRVLNVYVDGDPTFEKFDPVIWKNKQSSAPECLLSSLEIFEFRGFMGTQEERDFLSFFFKHASCLKSTSIIDRKTQLGI